jgi:TIR domain
MPESDAASRGRIFISYRREETAYPAGWLYERLAARYAGQVFKDVDSIELGEDFVDVITAAVGSCDVLLALIGDQWVADEDGRRRLDEPDDFVRLEIETALTRNVRVIPILVDGATMPRAEQLPPSLARLVRRQALELSPARFDSDTSRLLKVLDTTLAEVRSAQDDASALSTSAGRQATQNTAEDDAAADARTARGVPTGEGSTAPQPAIHPLHGSTSDHSQTPTSDEGEPRKKVSSSGPGPNRTLRRLVMIGVALAALLASYLIIQPVLDQPSQQENNAAQSSASNELKVEAPKEGVPKEEAPKAEAPKEEAPKPLLVDDFHTDAYGWEGPGGGYVNGMYRIEVEPRTTTTSSPRKPSSVYPSAPSDLRIEVNTRSLAPLDDRSGYGVICHLNEGTKDRYQFTIGEGGDDTVRITKFIGGKAQFLVIKSVASLTATDVNRVRADCTNVRDAAQAAVHLVFSLNGQIVAKATDRDRPLLDGTIGIRVFALGQNGIRVAFDNFVVTPV